MKKNIYLIYLFVFLNQLGTYTSYLAIVALPGSSNNFFLNLSTFFSARALGGIGAFKIATFLINKYGEKRCLLIGNIVSSISICSIMFSINNYFLISIFLFFVGFFDNLTSTALNSYNSKTISKNNLLRINHNQQFILYVTMIIGATLGGSLIQFNGLKFALIFDSISYLVSGLTVFAFKNPELVSNLIKDVNNNEVLRSTYHIPRVVIILLFLEVYVALVASVFNLIEIPYYRDHLGLTYSQMGPFFSVTILGLVIAKFVNKKINFNRMKIHQLIFLLLYWGTCFLSLSYTDKLWNSAICLFLFIGSLSLINSILYYFYQTILVSELRPRLLSLKYSLNKMVTVVSLPLVGLISDSFDIFFTIKITFLIFIFLLLPTFVETYFKRAVYEY